jgi:biopolymer transport protein ExbD
LKGVRDMNPGLRASLIATMMAAVPGAVFSQDIPLQAGVSVQLPVTGSAVAVPKADNQDALVVALTADGATYLGGNRLDPSALAERVKNLLSARNDKTLYIKADARVPYARVIAVIDAVRNSGVDALTFLTAQQDSAGQANRQVPSKGLEMRIK